VVVVVVLELLAQLVLVEGGKGVRSETTVLFSVLERECVWAIEKGALAQEPFPDKTWVGRARIVGKHKGMM
jgi:hypothetical protein